MLCQFVDFLWYLITISKFEFFPSLKRPSSKYTVNFYKTLYKGWKPTELFGKKNEVFGENRFFR